MQAGLTQIKAAKLVSLLTGRQNELTAAETGRCRWPCQVGSKVPRYGQDGVTCLQSGAL